MFEFGTEVFFAFWIASTSVGLPDRSAPPSFAATSMFLISLANDFARRWSLIAFWCLVVAHLEWPDMCLLEKSAPVKRATTVYPEAPSDRRTPDRRRPSGEANAGSSSSRTPDLPHLRGRVRMPRRPYSGSTRGTGCRPSFRGGTTCRGGCPVRPRRPVRPTGQRASQHPFRRSPRQEPG